MLIDEDEYMVELIEWIFELILIPVLLNVLHSDLKPAVNLVMSDLIDMVNDIDIDEVILEKKNKLYLHSFDFANTRTTIRLQK
jgi:hypothetical protein